MVKQKVLMMGMLLVFVPVWAMKKGTSRDEGFRLYDSQDIVNNEISELFEKFTLAKSPGKMVQSCYKEKPFDINIQHPDTHNTLLHCFVRDQVFNGTLHWKTVDLASFKFFFDEKADPNVRNGKGYSILHVALEASRFSESMIKILLENKADPNQDLNGQAPLYVFLNREYYHSNLSDTVLVTELLLESKADPNWQKKYNDERVFDIVMGKQHLNFLLVEPFIKSGVNPCRYYDYENLSYDKIDPNESYEKRIAYFMYLNAIPAWMLQKNKASLETFLLSLKFLKKKNQNLPLPPKRLLEYCIHNFILPGYGTIKKAIKHLNENNEVLSSCDQKDIDKKIKRFIALYS